MELQTVIKEYLAHCRIKELAERTQRAYRQDLKDFESWSEQEKVEVPFEKAAVLAWLEDMRLRKLSAATIKRRIACLRAMFRWLEDEGRMENNPFHKLHGLVRLPRRLPRNLTVDELRAIFEESDLRSEKHDEVELATFALALELLLATGVRVGELCDIRLEDIDLSGGTIRIRGKGNRERSVFVVDVDLTCQIEDYLKLRHQRVLLSNRLLFSPSGTSVTPEYIRKKLHQFVEDLELSRKITPHMFRHTAATRLLERGVDIRFVQKLLGHASISTTEIYTHVSDQQLKQAMSLAAPRRI